MSDESDTVARGAAGPPSPASDPPDEVSTDYAPLAPASKMSGAMSGAMRSAPVAGERIGKYVVEGVIGRGGMGIVVAARHEQLGERVAIKILHPKATKDRVQVERFVREARATVRIKSEHVVRVLDAGEEEGTGAPFIVMEYLDGHDIGALLEAHGAMPPLMAVDFTIQICEAVASAHALGIIHRDLKPSNFFVSTLPGGAAHVKVLDFGISKAAAQEGIPDPRLTETQAVFGSPTYMSPEQIRSSKNVDPRSDVWSLGVAMFEMLTGKLPFIADNVPGLLASVIADAPFRVAAFAPHVPEELEAIVLACLEKDPNRRVGSAAELALRLAPFASPEGAHLAARVDRVARGVMSSSASYPPPPATGTSPRGTNPRSHVPLPPLSRPSAPAPAVAFGAFGTTGADLSSSTGPEITRRSGGVPIVAVLGALLFVLAAGVGVGLYVMRARVADADRRSGAASNEASTGSQPPLAATVIPASASTAATASTTPSASSGIDVGVAGAEPATSVASARGRKGLAAGAGAGAARGTAPIARGASSADRAATTASQAAPASPPPATTPTHAPAAPGPGLDSRF